MLKLDITYDDFDGNERTDPFYFSFTKLEMIEKELELGGIENTIKQLSETQDAKKAYDLFKELVLQTVGKKSEDGKRFVKSPEIRAEFEQSNAMSELIFGFLKDAEAGAKFVEGVLPQKAVAEAKAEMARQKKQGGTVTELPTAPPVLAEEPVDYDALLAEADVQFAEADDEPMKTPVTARQAAFMKTKLTGPQFDDFMSTRYIED